MGMKINISAKNRSFVFVPVFNNITGRLTVNCVTNNKVLENFNSEETAEFQAQGMKINITAKNRSFVFVPVFNNIGGRLTVSFVTSNKDLNIKNIGVETAEPQSWRCDISVGDGSSLCSPVAHDYRLTLTINDYSQNDVLENFNSEERAEFQAQKLVPPMGAPAPGELIVNISAVNGSSIYSPVFNNCTGSLTINFFQVIRGKRCLCQESLLQEED
ncbi:uncharacterized protein LOC113656815 isoform X2 [Tachysurus fulvidraco]|uniref:uncharacterized protein LOC113656815 isoform X2 n=1 Tax=Tachysurus fulvidraco TaxID=1234273 RepID=UPI001FEEA639|nr:uncharacterized protein LOC113656815 isoform X2 [Tachysurus fulvidraco]